jgi:hypothetical protein
MGWVVVVLVALAGAGPARGDDGLVLRARGFVRGRSEIVRDRVRCEVPSDGAAVPDTSFVIGLLATAGIPTVVFPDPNNPFADPCGGWLQMQSSLAAQGIQLDGVELRYRLGGGAGSAGVPLRRGFPRACRRLRQARLTVGLRLDPEAATAYLPVLPMVSPNLLRCLQDALAAAPLVSVPLRIRARVSGLADAGGRFTSNPAGYTLTLVVAEGPLLAGPPSG